MASCNPSSRVRGVLKESGLHDTVHTAGLLWAEGRGGEGRGGGVFASFPLFLSRRGEERTEKRREERKKLQTAGGRRDVHQTQAEKWTQLSTEKHETPLHRPPAERLAGERGRRAGDWRRWEKLKLLLFNIYQWRATDGEVYEPFLFFSILSIPP